MKTLKFSYIKLSLASLLISGVLCTNAQSNYNYMRVEYNGMPSFGNFDGVYERTSDFQPTHNSNTCNCWKRIKQTADDKNYVITNDGYSWIVIEHDVCPPLTLPFNYRMGTIANSSDCDPTTVNGMTAIIEFPLLAVYYGYPSYVNGTYNVTSAVEVFNDYNIVIFPSSIVHNTVPPHIDMANTQTIIQALQTGGNNTQVYGYVDLGDTTFVNAQGVTITHENLTPAEINRRIGVWNDMGVAGIFFDDVEQARGVNRARLNAALTEAHRLGLNAMVNGNDPDEIFGSAGGEVLMTANDWYMIESFHVRNGIVPNDPVYVNAVNEKYSLAANYSQQYGTQIATVTTNVNANNYNQALLEEAWKLALSYGFDAFGWGEPAFSANTILPFRPRPDLIQTP